MMSGVGIDAYIIVVVDLFNVDVLVWQGGPVVHYLVGFDCVVAFLGWVALWSVVVRRRS